MVAGAWRCDGLEASRSGMTVLESSRVVAGV